MKEEDYRKAYEAVEKVMMQIRDENFRLKKRLAKYEPPVKEAEFLKTVKEFMGE